MTSTGPGSASAVLRVALRLGLTSFGGPIAHIGYFRREYVEQRRWLTEPEFADLVALCQSLPGPASSQLVIAVGSRRAGLAGAVAGWLGFTLPSAVLMIGFGLIAMTWDVAGAGWVHGLKVAAVAVVAQAVLLMARSLAPDWPRRFLALAAMAAALAWVSPYAQLGLIVAGGAIGLALLRDRRPPAEPGQGPAPSAAGSSAVGSAAAGSAAAGSAAAGSAASDSTITHRVVSWRTSAVALGLFAALLALLPLAGAWGAPALAMADAFYSSGALVFGGGHVVLPLLHANVVGPGWVTDSAFVAGYGAAQALPGPLFSFAGFLGTVSSVAPSGVPGGILAIVAIFLPGFLLVLGALPAWDRLRASPRFRRALLGVNAVVVGLLAAALYTPVWTTAIAAPADVVVAGAGFLMLVSRRVPPIAVVGFAAAAGQVLAALALAGGPAG